MAKNKPSPPKEKPTLRVFLEYAIVLFTILGLGYGVGVIFTNIQNKIEIVELKNEHTSQINEIIKDCDTGRKSTEQMTLEEYKKFHKFLKEVGYAK